MESPFQIGLRSARALLLPAVVLLGAGTALVISYYNSSSVHDALSRVAALKSEWGYLYSLLSAMTLAGFLPWVFRMLIPSLRPKKPLPELLFGLGWWGFMGLTVDVFYRTLSWAFDGSGMPVVAIVVCKVFADMFGFTLFFAAPANALSHLWKDAGFDFGALRRAMGPGWYRRLVLPNLVPNWMLWFPGVTLVYSMPGDLQVPMANLIGCFWSLLCIQIAAHTKGRVVVEPDAMD